MTHTLSRVLGAAALAASLATAGPAIAVDKGAESPPDYRRVAPAGESSPPALAGPAHRSIESDVVWRDGRLYLRGDVAAWFGRNVQVQRKACESCSWRRHDVVRTGQKGWFRSAISAPKTGSTFWRAKVRAAGGYARSFSATWETYY